MDTISFNPYRVFSSAETQRHHQHRRRHRRFNPYRVFSSAETRAAPPDPLAPPRFQSLSVFSSAETGQNVRYLVPAFCFNPYRVFSSAETLQQRHTRPLHHVSIPIGFSHQLRPDTRRRDTNEQSCFNPYRVFSSAETVWAHEDHLVEIYVSIPIGFSHQLRQEPPGLGPHGPRVSIPIGFSHQLRPPCPRQTAPPLRCFNPYRVFSSAETW